MKTKKPTDLAALIEINQMSVDNGILIGSSVKVATQIHITLKDAIDGYLYDTPAGAFQTILGPTLLYRRDRRINR